MQINCPACSATLPAIRPELAHCPSCRTTMKAHYYPALYKNIEENFTIGDDLQNEQQAACFYHPAKQVETSCKRCGRFICALCSTELKGEAWCTSCLAHAREHDENDNLVHETVKYDRIVFAISFWPMLIFFITPITAIVVLVLVVRWWNRPQPVIQRNRFRYVIAAILAIAQLGGWAVFGLSLLDFA